MCAPRPGGEAREEEGEKRNKQEQVGGWRNLSIRTAYRAAMDGPHFVLPAKRTEITPVLYFKVLFYF